MYTHMCDTCVCRYAGVSLPTQASAPVIGIKGLQLVYIGRAICFGCSEELKIVRRGGAGGADD